MADYEYEEDVENLSEEAQALFNMFTNLAIKIYEIAKDEISIAATLKDGRTIEATIKEVSENDN